MLQRSRGDADNAPLSVFDVKTGELLHIFRDFKYQVHAFLFDGKLVLSMGQDGVQIVNAESGKKLRNLKHPLGSKISVIATGNKMPVMAIGTDEGSLFLAQADDVSTPIRTMGHVHNGAIIVAAFSSDDRLMVTGGADGLIGLFDVQTSMAIGTPWPAHKRAVTAISMSADGRLVASGSVDGTVRIWDAVAGQPVTHALVGHTRPVHAVTFDPLSGDLLSYGGDGGELRRWKISGVN